MRIPETDSEYLALVIDAIVAAVAEASALLASGDPSEARELFRHAHDLLDILTDGIHSSRQTFDCVDRIRTMVLTMWSAAGGAALH
jgi:hypothetical protein